MASTICKHGACQSGVKPRSKYCYLHHYEWKRKLNEAINRPKCTVCKGNVPRDYDPTIPLCRVHQEEQDSRDARMQAYLIAEQRREDAIAARQRSAEEAREADLNIYRSMLFDLQYLDKDPKDVMIDLLQYIIERKEANAK